MVIHFLKEDCLTALKTNITGNIKHYSEPINDWIYEFFDGENPFLEYKFQIDDFQCDNDLSDEHDLSMQDVENVIRLYSSMKELTDTQATDERLWAGLAHGDFWKYMQNRWKFRKVTENTSALIQSRYFYYSSDGGRRALFKNSLARLWWIGKLTYDNKRKDPFELTRYMGEDFATKALVIFSSNYTSNPCVTHGLFSALLTLDNEGFCYGKKRRDIYYQATRYLNIFGGTHILDYYTEDEIKEKILNYMHNLK